MYLCSSILFKQEQLHKIKTSVTDQSRPLFLNEMNKAELKNRQCSLKFLIVSMFHENESCK